jgi:hypothetical protein
VLQPDDNDFGGRTCGHSEQPASAGLAAGCVDIVTHLDSQGSCSISVMRKA